MTVTTDKSHKIFMYDDLNPEGAAMLQALYSRSPGWGFRMLNLGLNNHE